MDSEGFHIGLTDEIWNGRTGCSRGCTLPDPTTGTIIIEIDL
jgi:hypothetical protein